MRKVLVVLTLAAVAACGGSSSNDGSGLNLYLTVDGGATKYTSGSAIDLGAFTTSDYGFKEVDHTFNLVNDSGQTVALDGIEFVDGALDDGTNKVTTTVDVFDDFWLSNYDSLTDATFAQGDSAPFTVEFVNWSAYVPNREAALWNARKKYRIKVTDQNDQPADFVFEVYGVASC